MKKVRLIIASFLCLLLLLNSFIILADYTYDPPVIQILYPQGGEKLNGTIKIQWFAISDITSELKINILYKEKNSEIWNEIIKFYPNNGEYNWTTNKLVDNIYNIRIFAIDDDNNIGIETSEEFTLLNGNIELEITDIMIMDKTIESSNWVKNRDNIIINAEINGLGSNQISKYNISADLTDLNLGNNVYADNYDGKNAIWNLFYVKCVDDKDEALIKINIDGRIEKNCTIHIDNEYPKLILKKPVNGIYLYNRKLFIPINKIIIFGNLEINIEAYDNCAIDKLELFIDGKLEHIFYNSYINFKLNNRLIGRHFLEFQLYDKAGNMISEKRIINIYNFV